jgi:cell division protein FtsZ
MSFNAFGAKIKVIGVGGGGGNAVNTMIRSGLEGVDFIVANTDAQALKASLAPHKIQLGKDLTKGLGAGADPDIGRDAALEDRLELQDHLSDADMVFITAGMGGGTGTGAAAVVAQIARELGALTVAVVTKPFTFEGKRRRKHAEAGVARLRECVDTLITIPNQRLLQVATPDLSMLDAFKLADNVLVNAVRGISDIINTPGLINVDFADVKTVMSSMGHALMGIGYGSGSERSVIAAKQAISSPLLEDVDIEGATGILINITAGTNVSIMEVNNACMVIQEAAHEDANIIFGAVIDEALGDEIRITVIATGFPVEDPLPADEGFTSSARALNPHGTRASNHTLPLPQRLVSPPRLTSQPVAPAKQAPTTAAGSASATASTTVASTMPRTSVIAPQRPGTVEAAAVMPRQQPVSGPTPALSNLDPTNLRRPSELCETTVAASPVDVAREAATLANWTLEEQSTDHLSASLELPNIELARSQAPGTPVFTATSPSEIPTKTIAEQVFSQDIAQDASHDASSELLGETQHNDDFEKGERAGAILASTESPWDFDAPNPDLVSSEIDRRIDEALALAGKMTQTNVERDAETTAGNEPSSLDLDDLDLPAFLRYGSDARPV